MEKKEFEKVSIVIPFKTPTINHLYYHRGNMKILKTEAREIRTKISNIVGQLKVSHAAFSFPFNARLKVTIEIFEDWLTLSGEVAHKDISNREKFLTDSVFKALDIDDKFIFELTYKKVISEEEKAIVTIEVIEDGI